MAIGNVHSKWLNGALVFYPEKNEQRWLDVVGDNVVRYVNDFSVCPHTTRTVDDVNCPEWIVTHTSGGTGNSGMTAGDLRGGGLKIYAASSENDGINAQLRNKTFKIEANSPLYFGVRWKIEDATQSDAAFGLSQTDTAFQTDSANGVWIGTTDGGTYIKLHCVKAATTVKTLVGTTGLTAGTMYIDEIYSDSTGKLRYWHNGTLVGTYNAGIPSTGMHISLSYLNGASSMGGKSVTVDWLRCFQVLSSRAT